MTIWQTYLKRIIGVGCGYQFDAARTMNDKLDCKDAEIHALHGLAGEVGEIHSIFQKEYQGHDIDPDHLKKEIGDLLWFIAELCTANQWDMEDVMDENIKKLRSRYPEQFDAEHSLRRKEGDI